MSDQRPSGAAEVRAASGGLVVVAAGQTDIGCRREVNQDALGNLAGRYAARAAELGLLYVVADGMGGHARGEVASGLAVEQIFARYYAADPAADPEETFARVLVATNAAVHEAGRAAGGDGMGTTVTAALLREDKLYVGNIGDSRTYRLREGRIQQLSLDHSLIGEQVRNGLLSAEQARRSNVRNVITRALGYQAAVEPDIFAHSLAPGDLLLLCSDGLHGLVEDAELARALAAGPLGEAVSGLIALARERGGPDNITALAVRVEAVPPNRAPGDDPAARRERRPAARRRRQRGENRALPHARWGGPTRAAAARPRRSTAGATRRRRGAGGRPADTVPALPRDATRARAGGGAARRRAGPPARLLALALAPFLVLGLFVAFFLVLPQVRGGAATPTAVAAEARATSATPPAAAAMATAAIRGQPVAAEGSIIEGAITAPGLGLDLPRDWEVALIPANDPADPGPPTRPAVAVAPIEAGPDGATAYRLAAPEPGVYTIVVQRRGATATGAPTRLQCLPDRIAVPRGETTTRDLVVAQWQN